VRPDVLVSRIREVLACDVRQEASRIGVPVLYIRAKRDRLVASSCLEELRAVLPRMFVVEIDGPHLILQCEPLKAAKAILRFLAPDRELQNGRPWATE
jgi:pimeloyl-ACP methyl ester carboxylesterase